MPVLITIIVTIVLIANDGLCRVLSLARFQLQDLRLPASGLYCLLKSGLRV